MAGPGYILNKPFIPGGAIGQWKLVKMSASDTVIVCSATGDNPIGICMETISAQDATDGRVATIALLGVSRAIAGAAVAAGAVVMNDSTGRVVTATSTNFAVGRAVQSAGAANDQIDIILNPIGVVI